MKTLQKYTFCIVILMLMSLTGCETVAGFGKDMESGGKALQKEASNNSNSDHNGNSAARVSAN